MGLPRKLPFEWETVKKYSRRAGKEGMALAEATWRTLKDPAVDWKQKGVLIASLAYFLSPLDAIPDFLPGGYVDDLSLLLASLVGIGSVGKKHLADCRKKHGLKVDDDEENPPEN